MESTQTVYPVEPTMELTMESNVTHPVEQSEQKPTIESTQTVDPVEPIIESNMINPVEQSEQNPTIVGQTDQTVTIKINDTQLDIEKTASEKTINMCSLLICDAYST